MTNPQVTPALKDFCSREFHKVTDVAKFAKLGRNTVYSAATRGELKSKKYGNIIRIRTLDALEWLGIPFPEEEPAEEKK